jgi:hypothetical protein
MAYVMPCMLPNFRQSVPSDGEWRICDASRHSGQNEWQNVATGETVIVPAIWYNAPASSYARTLRFNAEGSEQSAKRKRQEDVPASLRNLKPWDIRDAERFEHQARRLRAMAALCDRNPTVPAGRIDFRGLKDPTTPNDAELTVIEAIERGE